jgi:hypothetical protein
MNPGSERLYQLLDQFRQQGLTSPEADELQNLLQAEWEAVPVDKEVPSIDWEAMFTRIIETDHEEAAPVIPMARPSITRWVSAAVVIALLGIGSYVFLINKGGNKKEQPSVAIHDVPAPASTRAVITLADCRKVYLDSACNGTIAKQDNVTVIKNKNGAISYQPTSASGGQQLTAYNTLYNPRGSKLISLTLSDGTRVWLNSESSLKYPTAFNNKTREVEITGEAYFEVKHDASHPFKVHLPNGGIVEDLGTAFNINAYPDEDAIKTTLIEGSVIISESQMSLMSSRIKLKPGEQAVLFPQGGSQKNDNVDLEAITAWKNGLFQFNDAPINVIMRQVARWYDVDVIYQGVINKTFRGEIPRTVNASELFQILESTGWVHFQIDGRKVVVMPHQAK